MLWTVLRRRLAVEVNVELMRAFVRVREMIAGRADLVRRLDALEQRYDAQFRAVFDAICALISDETKPPKSIGFHAPTHERSS